MKNLKIGLIFADLKTNKCIKSTGVAALFCKSGEIIPCFVVESIEKINRELLITLDDRNYMLFSSKLNDDQLIVAMVDITPLDKMSLENEIMKKAIGYVQDAVYAIDKDGNEIFHNKIERFIPVYKEKLIREMKQVFIDKVEIPNLYNVYLNKEHKEIHMLSTFVPVINQNEVKAVLLINRYLNRVLETLTKAQNLQYRESVYKRKKLPNNNTSYTFDDIIGESYIINATKESAIRSSKNNVPILIQGETGTGKELFAQSIHNHSDNAKEPFLAVNCATIPETLLESILFGTTKGIYTGAENKWGLMEQAGEGTLFLDEINSMSSELQAKLLRAIQERKIRRLGDSKEMPIKCRLISSTNQPPEKLIDEGKMREDFFYRIAAFILVIPPLRERGNDIIVISKHFINKFNRIYGKFVTKLSPSVEKMFLNHKWPGNIRELEYVIESSYSFIDEGTTLTENNLPEHFRKKINRRNSRINIIPNSYEELIAEGGILPETLNEFEKKIIEKALMKNKFNITKTAKMLGIKRQNLQSRMKKLSIKKIVTFDYKKNK